MISRSPLTRKFKGNGMSMATGQLTPSLTIVKCANGETEEKDIAREKQRERKEKERVARGQSALLW